MKPFTALIDFATPEYDDTLRLRYEILRKPLNMVFEVDQISQEYEDFHLAYYDKNFELCGCMVLSPKESGNIKMRQVAVAESCQRQGIGKQMVHDCERIVAKKGYTTIVLNARDVSIPFYLKLGYEKVGDEFIEVGISHFKMQKTVAVF